MSTTAYTPFTLGSRELSNRFVMSPMTRNRATATGEATELMATYYAQRAEAGLLVTEGTQPSAIGQGYPHTPGLHTDGQVESWRQVTAAVHDAGSVIFAQLMHCGRISHPDTIGGTSPVGPSAVAAAGQTVTPNGMADFVTPRALETDELPGVVEEFVDASRRAIDAGFDGVELHGANGYLLQQFLAAGTNTRTDSYGGSVQNRARFVLEVAAAVVEAVGADRVGIRLSPQGTFNDIAEGEDSEELYRVLGTGLGRLELAYVHVIDPTKGTWVDLLRPLVGTTVIGAFGFDGREDLDAPVAAVDDQRMDLVAIGRAFLANPDLVTRLRDGVELNTPDPATFYGGSDGGYTDYPTMAA